MNKRVLDIIGWVGVALVLAAFTLWILRPEWWELVYSRYLALAGLVCVLLYPIANWRDVASHFNRRQTQYATVASASVLVVLGILVAVNYLSNRRNVRWDLTENQVNSLSEQSLKVLSDLDGPLNLVVIDRGGNLDQHRPRMSMYDNASNQVSVEFFDFERDPIRARQYDIQVAPTVVLEYMGRTEKVTTLDERELTSAIIRAVTGQERKLYFVQGHGERDPAGSDGEGYGGVAQFLRGDNIAVEPLALSEHKDVPDDATVVAIVGPTADFLDEEIEQLRRYLDRGGKLLAMLEPALGERARPIASLTTLLREWGIDVGNDVILDVSGLSNSPVTVVATPPHPSHPIVDGFGLSAVFPLARSVTPVAPAPDGKTVQPFIRTTEAAWAETDLAGLQTPGSQPAMDEGSDIPGPVGIAATVSTAAAPPTGEDDEGADTPPQTRLAVFGDADFASNAVGNSLGNADLFLNTVNWLSAQEDLIAIRPREPRDSRLTITPGQMDAVWWLSVAAIPMAVVGAGLYTWMRRRRT